MTNTTAWRYTTVFFFIIYLLILVKQIVFKYPVDPMTVDFFLSFSNGNYVPFKTIFGYLGGEPSWSIAFRNLAGNILLFVPLGVFLPLIFRTSRRKSVLLIALLFSVFFEILQILFSGTPDIDDVLLNTLGAVLGYLFFCVISQIWRRLVGCKEQRR